MTDPAAIAAGLTEAQKRDLLRIGDGIHFPSWSIFCLIWDGLATYRREFWLWGRKVVRLTRKGQAVRAHLEGEAT